MPIATSRETGWICSSIAAPDPADRLWSLRPAFAQSQYAGAGRMPLAVARPGPALGLDPIAGEPRAECGDDHRAHPIGTARNRIGLGVDQKWFTHLVPGQADLF